MLVSAFAGRERVLEAYRDAVAAGLPFLQLWRRDADPVRPREARRRSRRSRSSDVRAVSGAHPGDAPWAILIRVKFTYEEFDLSGVRTYPLASRKSKANAADFAKPYRRGGGVARAARFVAGDPRGRRLQGGRRGDPRGARAGGRGIIWGFGAHVIKTGPRSDPDRPDGARLRVGDRDERRRHHSRLRARACRAATSEDVDEALGPGRFGMAEETGELLNGAISDGRRARARARPGGRPSICARATPAHAASERAGRGRTAARSR